MNKVAQEKARKAIEFLNDASQETLGGAEPGARGMLLAKLRATSPPEFSSIDIRRLGASKVETINLRVEGAAEIAAASEALDKADEHVRRALCGVLDRLGADGATAFINGDSPEDLSDDIYRQTRYLQEQARHRVEVERDQALTKLDTAKEVIGEVRGVCKAGEDELTVMAVRRALRERDDEIRQLKIDRHALARGIATAAQSAGIYNGAAGVTGPTLIMFCENMAEEFARLRETGPSTRF